MTSPRFVLPTIAAPTLVPTSAPPATPTPPAAGSLPPPPEPPTPDVQLRAPRPAVTPFAPPAEPTVPRPRETATPILTPSPTPRPVHSPTVPPRPTETPTPSPRPTETRTPTATREPPTTPTPAHPFVVERTYSAPNCAATEVRGRFLDKAGRGVAGNVVRVTPLHRDAAPILGLPSRADGTYEVVLRQGPEAGRWQVQALAAGGQPLSPPILVETTADHCRSAAGRQTVYVEFRQAR
ncbi:MAG: hypothetical protein RMM58_03300 [Chloroflexota bacterium]|nr:hypothetical protein [Chloroflexota bacterium]